MIFSTPIFVSSWSDGIDEYKDEGLDLQSFVVVKNNQSRTYNLVEGDNKSYVSLMDYEIDIPQIFDPWNKTQSQALNADQVEDVTKDCKSKPSSLYSSMPSTILSLSSSR